MTAGDLSRPTLDEGSSGPAAAPLSPAASSPPERWQRGPELGWGGMGRIVLTRDAWLGREVALKEPVRPHDADHVRREALLTAGLEHPGIIPVYDTGASPDGRPWFAMQIVRGRSLADILAGHPPVSARYTLIRHLVAAAEAVGYAHARGIVHRDLKPANVMIGPFGDTKVIDWGLAMRVPAPSATTAELSGGTLRSMSPEQARGEPQGPPSDVWSLGAILWELIAGQPPFPQNDPDILRAELAAARLPRLAQAAPHAVPALASIVHRAMDPDPARRFPDAGAFATELQRFIDGQLVTSHAYTRLELLGRFIRAWRGTLITSALSLVAVVTALGVGFQAAVAERDRAEHSLALSLVANARHALRTEALADAELLSLQALERTELPEARGVLAALGAHFRPARTQIATLDCTPLDLHPELLLCASGEELHVRRGQKTLWRRNFPDFRHAVFYDDGRKVAVVMESTVEALEARTGVSSGPSLARICGRPRPSLGARFAVFSSATCATQLGAEGFSPAPQGVCDIGGFSAFAVSHDGSHAIALCRDGFLVADRRERLGIAPRLPLPPPLGAHDVSAAGLHRDGRTAILGTEDGALWVLDLGSGALSLIERGEGRIARILVSPDGRRALVRRESGPPQLLDIAARASLGRVGTTASTLATFRTDGRVLTAGRTLAAWNHADVLPRTLQFPEAIQALTLSPDGRLVAVAAASTAYVIDIRSRREVARTRLEQDIVRALAFSSDSRALLVHSFATGSIRRFPLAPTDGAETQLPGLSGTWRQFAEGTSGELVTVSHAGVVARQRVGQSPQVLLSAPSVADAAVSLDASRVVLMTETGDILVHGPAGQTEHCTGPRGGRAVALGEGGRVLVARRDSVETACVSDATKIVMRAAGHELASLAAGHGFVAAGARDGSLHIWRTSDGTLLSVTQLHAGRIEAVVFDPEGEWIATAGADGRLAFMALPDESPVNSARVASAIRLWGLEPASDDLFGELLDAP